MKHSLESYVKQLGEKLIAVDFDNTITHICPYPEKGKLNLIAKKYLTKLHNKGYRLVLWSARLSEGYEEAYSRCIFEFDMPFIERDSETLIHGSTGKLLAAFYIDDKGIPGKMNWRKIYKHILKTV